MRYFANPSTPAVREAMRSGLIDCITTPAQGNKRPEGAAWCADNGCFSDKWDEAKWWRFLEANAHDADSCRFAVAPDVVGDAWRTGIKSLPWLEKIRALGYPVAWVAQDGQQWQPLPWNGIDALFIGGTDAWKLGHHARELAAEAKARCKWVHMGRVNSLKRLRYAQAIGCDSADGTYVTFGPDVNLPHILGWVRDVTEQNDLLGLLEAM